MAEQINGVADFYFIVFFGMVVIEDVTLYLKWQLCVNILDSAGILCKYFKFTAGIKISVHVLQNLIEIARNVLDLF